MIPADAHLLAFIAVCAVLQVLLFVLLWREVCGSRRDHQEARAREQERRERIAPPRPERRRMGFVPGPGDDGPPRGSAAEVVHYPEGSEDAEGTVREVAT